MRWICVLALMSAACAGPANPRIDAERECRARPMPLRSVLDQLQMVRWCMRGYGWVIQDGAWTRVETDAEKLRRLLNEQTPPEAIPHPGLLRVLTYPQQH